MKRSPELEAILRRIWDAMARGDSGPISSFLLNSPETMWVGSDAREEWFGSESVAKVMQAQLAGAGPQEQEVLQILAWEQGNFGWGYSTARLSAEFRPVDFRITAVFLLVDGAWKVPHSHSSVAVSNIEAFGRDYTTSVDLVATAVEVEQPDLTTAAAPDGTVTVLFTDIEGSTERNAVLGDRAWMKVLRHHHDLIREQTAANGGFEVKSMGDGFMLAFSSARKALQCALDIQRAIGKEPDLDVRVRAGLHAGEAVRVGDDFYGGVVNMAARVAGQAAGGEVLASGLVRGLVESSGEFTFADSREAELKGFPGTHHLHPLTQ